MQRIFFSVPLHTTWWWCPTYQEDNKATEGMSDRELASCSALHCPYQSNVRSLKWRSYLVPGLYIYLSKAASISSHTLETERQRERGEILISEDWWRLCWILMRGTTTSSAAWRSPLQQAPRTLADDCLLCLCAYMNGCLRCVCVCEACDFSIPCVHCSDFWWSVFSLTSH